MGIMPDRFNSTSDPVDGSIMPDGFNSTSEPVTNERSSNIWKPGDPVKKTGFSFVSWITPDIAISSYDVASDDEVLKIEGIRTVVSIGSFQAHPGDPSIIHEGFPFISDGVDDNHIQEVVDALKAIHHGAERGKTLVHCAAGVSRSPAFVTAYLSRLRKISWDDALEVVRKGRPQTKIHPLVEKQMRRFGMKTESK